LEANPASTRDVPPGGGVEPAPHGYSSFGSRLLASVLDSLVTMNGVLFACTSLLLPRSFSLVFWAPLMLSGSVYTVAMHAHSGQTLGKMIANIRVVRVTGERMSWRDALLRSSVQIGIASLGVFANLSALSHLPAASWDHGWLKIITDLGTLEPAWRRWVGIAGDIWFFCELVVLLSSPKRRALHDFMAGTVVVRTRGNGRRRS
jgi:uncharacterized RDD family membrane protein YckC